VAVVDQVFEASAEELSLSRKGVFSCAHGNPQK
jgi:hypothetical protein